jgi:4a-hydroxytetrahydrobiopterin dehydratase
MVTTLSQSEIEKGLAGVAGWTLDSSGEAITRTFTLPSFPAALVFASAVGNLAERADHHPDILIQYKKVTLTLSTHSEGGLTKKDFALAHEIDQIAR